jgi:hypothetical protein
MRDHAASTRMKTQNNLKGFVLPPHSDMGPKVAGRDETNSYISVETPHAKGPLGGVNQELIQ